MSRILSTRDIVLLAAAACVALPVGWLLAGVGGNHGGVPQSRDARSADVKPPADRTGSVTSAAKAPPAPPSRDGVLTGVPEVLDTTTLQLSGKPVRLFGVEWARGGKPDELKDYLAGRAVSCASVPKTETFRCEVGGQDLARVVLYNGGGRATFDAPPDLKAAEQRARSEHIGVWAPTTP